MPGGNKWRVTNRRGLLTAIGSTVGIMSVAGCSGEETPDTTTDTTTTTSQTQTTSTGGDETTQTTEAAKQGGDLLVAAPGDPQNLDPHTTTINVAQMVLSNVMEGLFELTKEMEIAPKLATDYTISDDETTYEMSLREGVTFHDGSKFTSADVKYTIERILDPDVGSPRAANFSKVETVETPDDYTARFVLSEPFAPFLLGMAESATVIPEGSAENTNLKQHPIGTGPFSFESWQTDDEVALTKFDDYYDDDRPYLDSVTFNVIPESATRLTQLQNESAHVMFGVPYQKANELSNTSNTVLQSVSGLWKQAFWFNTDKEPFTDPLVRRAVSHALDRTQFVQGVLFGHGQVAHSPAPPTSSWSDTIDGGDPHAYSLETARSLMKDAGVEPASIKTTIKASRTPGTTYADTATLAQAMLSRLGMSVDVEIMDFSTWLQDVWVDKNFDLSVGSWSGRVDPDGWYYRQYHSEGPWNRWNYANDEVDALLEEGRVTTDPDKRASIYSDIDTIVSQDAPMVYLYFRQEMTGLTNGVGGYDLTPTNQSEFESVFLK